MTKKPTPHRGVRLMKNHRGNWVARWEDPITKKTKERTLSPGESATKALRTSAAKAIAAERNRVKEASKDRRSDATSITTVEQLGADYLASLKPSTRTSQNNRVLTFAAWCAEKGIKTTAEIRPVNVTEWCDHCMAQENHQKSTQQTYIKTVTAMLRWGILRMRLPLLSKSEVSDQTVQVKVPKKVNDYMRPQEIQKLLRAWIDYDENTKGRPTAHVALAFLLTGCRITELLGNPHKGRATDPLQWDEVSFDREQLELDGKRVKTGEDRFFPFDVSPALHSLLAALNERTGGHGDVFGDVTAPVSNRNLATITKKIGRKATAHTFRRTSATIMHNAPGISRKISTVQICKRHGHSLAEAAKSYIGHCEGLPPDAETFEAATGIEDLATEIISKLERRGLRATA